MAKIEEQPSLEIKKVPQLTPLSAINPGECFGFRDDTIEEIMSEDGPGLWSRVKSNLEKTGRIQIFNLKTGELAERDETHKVVHYPVIHHVGKPKMLIPEKD